MKYLAFATVLLLTACKHNAENTTEKTVFSINDSIRKIITIDTVKSAQLRGTLDLTGEVTYNQNTVVRVMPLVSGTLSEVNVQMGDYVKKGDVLATIRSAALAELQRSAIAAQANLSIAKKNLEVAKDLAEKGINSQKDVLEAQQDVYKAEAELASSQKELAVIGGSEHGAEIVVKAPVNGYIVARNVNPNQVIEGSETDPMFIVSDLKQVWVIASVYEDDIAKITMNDDVDITTIAYPDKVFHGRISYISSVLDPENKTMQIRIVLDNSDYSLKPEMFAKVTLDFTKGGEVPIIPRGSIVFDDNKFFAIVYKSDSNLEVRPIDIYPNTKEITFVRSGLKVGEHIISKNQLLIYNQLNQL